MMVETALFTVLVVEFLAPSSNQKKTHKIKAKSDKTGSGCKSRYLLNAWHYLGDSVENAQTSQYQCNRPDALGRGHLFVGHG
ncbi:MAG: hypothetical protein KFF68_14070 [Desulfosarcina sp.]|nr:hypothetical protein [Desulfosarcina sp.]